jgi:hypothetical protein
MIGEQQIPQRQVARGPQHPHEGPQKMGKVQIVSWLKRDQGVLFGYEKKV